MLHGLGEPGVVSNTRVGKGFINMCVRMAKDAWRRSAPPQLHPDVTASAGGPGSISDQRTMTHEALTKYPPHPKRSCGA